MRTRVMVLFLLPTVLFMGGVAAVAQPSDQPTTGFAPPMPELPITVPGGPECEGSTVQPWPKMPTDGWLDETSIEQSTALSTGTEQRASALNQRVFQTMMESLGGSEGELQQFEQVVCTTEPEGGWVIESLRATIENEKGEVVQFARGQLVKEQSLFNYAFIGGRETVTFDNGIQAIFADAGHRTEAIVVMPSGRVVWILARGVNSPSYEGFPTTRPPLPLPGEPEEVWLRGEILVEVALDIAKETECGTAPSAVNVVTGDAWLLDGTNHRDYICSRGGQSTLRGLGGNDILKGGGGRDILLGGRGRDRLSGQGGNDVLIGGAGKDRLRGGGGVDTCSLEKPARRSCENDR